MLEHSTGMLEVAEERHGEPIELFADLADISKLEDYDLRAGERMLSPFHMYLSMSF
jgi:hypothetical protein